MHGGACSLVDGSIYVADGRVIKYSTAGAELAVWGEPANRPGHFWQDNLIACGSDGTVYALYDQVVQVFDADGLFLRRLKLDMTGLGWVSGFQVDGHGNLVVAGAPIVRKYSPDGVVKDSFDLSQLLPRSARTRIAVDNAGQMFLAIGLERGRGLPRPN
jgi:hypothetical protein